MSITCRRFRLIVLWRIGLRGGGRLVMIWILTLAVLRIRLRVERLDWLAAVVGRLFGSS